MPEFRAAHRVPRPYVDRIADEVTALALLSVVTASPPRPETIAVLLDDQRRGISVFVVSGTTSPDAVLDVVDVIGAAAQVDDLLGGILLASVRPGGAVEADDVDRWLGASDALERRGVELVEWFVIGETVECPRDLLGAAPRW
jgi:hypothetical protein